MKLTKEDFDLHKCNEKESYMFICKQNPLEVVKQILENQKLRELIDREIDTSFLHGNFLERLVEDSKDNVSM